MSIFVRRIGILVAVAAVTVLGLGAVAYIQPAAAAQLQSVTSAVSAHGVGPGFGGPGFGVPGVGKQAGLEAAATALNMTVDELTTQLQAGKTLADLATAAGVDLQTVRDAVTAANTAATKTAIEQAVSDGTLARDEADWLLQGLDKGYWGAGDRLGFGHHGGLGGGRLNDNDADDVVAPTATPASNS